MATTNENQDIINEIETTVPILNNKIKDGIEEYKNFFESLKDEEFIEKENEKEEDAIKRAESIFDRLDEMMKRNDLSNKKALETIELLTKTTDLFKKIVRNIEIEKGKLAERNNELIDVMVDLEQRKKDKIVENLLNQVEETKQSFNKRKVGLDEQRIIVEKKQQEEGDPQKVIEEEEGLVALFQEKEEKIIQEEERQRTEQNFTKRRQAFNTQTPLLKKVAKKTSIKKNFHN